MSIAIPFFGGVGWLYTMHAAVKENRTLREGDKHEILGKIKELEKDLKQVEIAAVEHGKRTNDMFMTIREDIAELKAQISLFLQK